MTYLIPPPLVTLALAFPHLRPAEQRNADVAVHVQLLAAIGQLQFDLVGLAVVRVEDLAAVPLVAILLHAPHDGHALDRLVVARTFALVADRMRTLLGEQHLLDDPLQRAVWCLADLDDGFGLAGFVVHLRPGSDGRVLCGRSRRFVGGERRRAEQQRGGDERGGEQGAHGGSPWDTRSVARRNGPVKRSFELGLWHNCRLHPLLIAESIPCLRLPNPASASCSRASLTRTPAPTW